MTSPTNSSNPSPKLSFSGRAKARSVYKRLAAARLQTLTPKKQSGSKKAPK